jgi:hypothetical protein
MFRLIQKIFEKINYFLSLIKVPYPLDIYEWEDNEEVCEVKHKEKQIFTSNEFLHRYDKKFNDLCDTPLTYDENKEVEKLYNEQIEKLIKLSKLKLDDMEKVLNDKISKYEEAVKEEKNAFRTKKEDLKLIIDVKGKDIQQLYKQIHNNREIIRKMEMDSSSNVDLKKIIIRSVLKQRLCKNNFICEYVPNNGNVIFYYNNQDDVFCYYSNYTILSPILDSICKSFCIKNKIKELFMFVKQCDETYKPDNKYRNVGRMSDFIWLNKPPPNKKSELSWRDYKKQKNV